MLCYLRRKKVSAICAVAFFVFSINVYYYVLSRSFWNLLLCVAGCVVFIAYLMPCIRNQRVKIDSDEIVIFSFGKAHKLKLSDHLYAMVVEDNEPVSYRLRKDGKYFQVSPCAYYEDEKLKDFFLNFIKKNEPTLSVIER